MNNLIILGFWQSIIELSEFYIWPRLAGSIVGYGFIKNGVLNYKKLDEPIHNRITKDGLDYLYCVYVLYRCTLYLRWNLRFLY